MVLGAQSLTVRFEGDRFRLVAPQLRLLTKETVDRLHDGVSVGFTFQVAIASDRNGNPIDQMTYRFVFSYDLWEEKFAVTRLEPTPRAISHLSAAAAEAWCLDSLMIPTGNLLADRPFWVSMTYSAEAGQRGVSDNSGLTLGGLVDIFSRRNQRQPVSGSRNAGPFRLIDLRRR